MYDYTNLENVNEIKMSDYIILPKKKNIINFNEFLKKIL